MHLRYLQWDYVSFETKLFLESELGWVSHISNFHICCKGGRKRAVSLGCWQSTSLKEEKSSSRNDFKEGIEPTGLWFWPVQGDKGSEGGTRRDDSALVSLAGQCYRETSPQSCRQQRASWRGSCISPKGVHVVIHKVPSPVPSKQLPSICHNFGSWGIFAESLAFYTMALLFQVHLNNALNNAMPELNNEQQQQEREIQRNRRGAGDAFADQAGSVLVWYRKAVPDGRSYREEGSYNKSSGAAGHGEGVRKSGKIGRRERDHAWKRQTWNNRERVHPSHDMCCLKSNGQPGRSRIWLTPECCQGTETWRVSQT